MEKIRDFDGLWICNSYIYMGQWRKTEITKKSGSAWRDISTAGTRNWLKLTGEWHLSYFISSRSEAGLKPSEPLG